MSQMIYVFVALLSLLVTVKTYPSSIPADACTAMFPEGHAVIAQSVAPPFTLTVSASSYTIGSPITAIPCPSLVKLHPRFTRVDIDGFPNNQFHENYTVTLQNITSVIAVATRPEAEAFAEGFFVQARKAVGCGAENNVPQGTFAVTDSLLTTMSCSNNNDAVRHSSNAHKHTSSFTWTAAQDVGPIYFRATVVWHKEQFWMNVFSTIIDGPTSPGIAQTICNTVQTIPASMTTQTPPPTLTTPTSQSTSAHSIPLAVLAITTFISVLF